MSSQKRSREEYFATQPAPHHQGQHGKTIWYAPNKFDAYGEEEIQAVTACLRDGWLAPGPRTCQFEKEVCAFFGKRCGIFVNSGSSAVTLSLLMAGCKRDDEVITPACTFSTTVAPMVQLGIKPVFCDVQVRTFVPSVDQIIQCITPQTKAVNLPNLAGSKPDYVALKRHLAEISRSDIVIIEDSCDTMTFTEESDISVVSFYASHVITAGGGGGMVMCNSESMRDLGLQYRDWGRIGNNIEDPSERFGYCVDGIPYDFKFLYGVIGYNFKSTEMNAAFGLVQLQKLPVFLQTRRQNIDRYKRNLKDSPLTLPLDADELNWLAMPLLVPEGWCRQSLLHHLENNGIQTRVFFAGNITRHPAYREFFDESNPNRFPNSDRIMRDCFLLGAHHGLSVEDVDYVCGVIKSYSPNSILHEKQEQILDDTCAL